MVLIGFSTSYINIPIYNNINVLQVFLGDPGNAEYEINFPSYDKKSKKIFIHSKYTYNISKKNINYPIKTEIEFLKKLKEKNTGIVIHLSKYYINNREEALKDVAEKLNILCEKYLKNTSYSILLETSQDIKHLGSQIDDFYIIYKYLHDLSKNHIGICLDTSHVYLSGININDYRSFFEYLSVFEQKIGLKNIKLIHLNDINSEMFGAHTPHLSILDSNGKIFFNNYLILDIVLNLSEIYNIPIILERNSDIQSIKEEISFIKQRYNNISNTIFNTIIKYNIVIFFLNTVYDYYNYIEPKYLLENIKKLKKKIILTNSIDDLIIEKKNSPDLINSKRISSAIQSPKETKAFTATQSPKETKAFTATQSPKVAKAFTATQLSDSNLNSIIKDIFNILNNYSYNIFLKYIFNEQYQSLKQLSSIKFIGIETAKKIYYQYNINTIQELLSLSVSMKKKILSISQYKALQCYKFIQKNIPNNILLLLYNDIKNKYVNNNVFIYGSVYRLYTQNLIENNTYKDIDMLYVTDKSNDIDNFLINFSNDYMLKGILLDGPKHKNMVYKFVHKKKNYYFILDLYICLPEEFVFMSLFLKGPIYKNIALKKIAKSKGYLLSNTFLQDSNGKKYFFNSEKELIDFIKA